MVGLIGVKSCRSCEFKCSIPAAPKKLYCRRFPPTNIGGFIPGPRGEPTSAFFSSYPEVNPDLPCGEYRRNELHAKEELASAGAGMTTQ